jgi:oxygen-independent coproporphyrinogen-3 oxidase
VDSRLFQAVLRAADGANVTGYPNQYPPLAAWDPVRADAAVRSSWRAVRGEAGEIGLYVHVPFCRARCSFCFLPVWSARAASVGAYLDALESEAAIAAGLLDGRPLRSVYVGGGTPTMLSESELERVFGALRRLFRFGNPFQFAVEANPESLSLAKARLLRAFGADWVTMGVQSLDANVLRRAGRRHGAAAARAGYDAARAAGVPGVNVDLLFGLPGQSRESFLADVREVAGWGAEQVHLNVYVNAPNTALARRGHRVGRAAFEECLAVQAEGFAALASAGYRRLDADSAGRGPESVNWQGSTAFAEGASILGLGPTAVSYARGRMRYVNAADPESFRRAAAEGRLPVARGTALTPRQERLNLLLRGLERNGRVEENDAAEMGDDLRDLEESGALERVSGGWRLGEAESARFDCLRRLYEPEVAEKIAARYGLREALAR